MRRCAWSLLVATLSLLAGVVDLPAQVAPNARWRTIRTPHFYVHFAPAVEEPARRAAVFAERAYADLASRLHTPRGPIDLVVSDDVDYANGSTTIFPTNRIVIYAHPPLDAPALRFYDDWLQLVITHELTHTFHLDRASGLWAVGQRIFGRWPYLMPAVYEPAWVTEGLATFYESDVTGAGRVKGTYERMLVRASVLDGRPLPIDQWSLASTRYPGGEAVYAYGSLFFDYLARSRGSARVAEFVERASRALPFTLDRVARRSFGVTFDSAWREWSAELARQPGTSVTGPLTGWRDLTNTGRLAVFPRWSDRGDVVYVATGGKQTTAAYSVSLDGRVTRIGRRNGTDINTPLPDGGLLFAQLEFTDPYRIRSDLWVQRDGRTERLTKGARLSQPDARRDGAIVAVRATPATNQLVRLSADGRTSTPLTTAALDTQWAEPRWSPAGDRIAVTRWTRGGYADVVVLDSTGALIRELTHDRAYDGSPSWTPDGRALLFSSDRSGINELYTMDVAGPDGAERSPPRRLSRAASGVFAPSLSLDGRTLAALRFAAGGYYVGVAPFDTVGADTVSLDPAFAPPPVAIAPAPHDDSPSTPYSPWRSLVPRYWVPVIGEAASGSWTLGAATSGFDVVGRHSYVLQGEYDPRGGDHTGYAAYSYSGLGQPLLDVSAEQLWDRFSLRDAASKRVGDLRRRTQRAALGVTVTRPRLRSNAFATLGGEVEAWRYSTDPSALFTRVDPRVVGPRDFRSLFLSAGFSNAQRPTLSISPEDGIALASAARVRWRAGEGASDLRRVIGVFSAYKSLDLPGYAHHVLAARVAAGTAEGPSANGEYGLGGTTGEAFSIVPGLNIGQRRTFFVRGFPSDAQIGAHVVTGSLEYRAPLFAPGRGYRLLPVFLDRTSVSFFADAGSAWDRWSGRGRDPWLASAGAELNLDAALQYDFAYRFRLGIAAPVVRGQTRIPVSSVSAYVRVGTSF